MFDKYRITHTDGTVHEVLGKKSDVVKFEREFKMPAANILDSGAIYIEHLWYFGWLADERENNTGTNFNDWIETVESVEILTVEDQNPTQPNPSPTL